MASLVTSSFYTSPQTSPRSLSYSFSLQDPTTSPSSSDKETENRAREIGLLILNWVLILFLICLSAMFSGLTLGLLSLDKIGLEIVIGGDPESDDAKYAKIIYPIRANGDLLLCTLLLGNTCTNATLSVLLASYTSGAVGVAVSTGLIVLFGEIIPQAVGSRHALYIGAHTIWLVKFFIVLFYPAAKPVSLVLRYMFADEVGNIYSSSQLSKLLEIHAQHKAIDTDQVKIMHGAIDFRDKVVEQVMTPKEKIFMLSVDTVLDFATMTKVFQEGYSRIPVYKDTPNNIVGLLLTKDLIVIDPEDCISVQNVISFFGRPVQYVWGDTKLSEALALFKTGKAHLAMVRDVNNNQEEVDPFYEVIGLVTLEDIIEEIIQDEINDETDLYVQTKDYNSKAGRELFDLDRLRLLDSKHSGMLSKEEVNVVCAHLKKNVVQFANFDDLRLQTLVSNSPVLEFSFDKNGKFKELYKKDKPIMHFTLILSGKLRISSGREDFLSEAGPWTVLGAPALLHEEGTYISDFTATVTSETLRCVRFSKRDYDRFLSQATPDAAVVEQKLSNIAVYNIGSQKYLDNILQPSKQGNGDNSQDPKDAEASPLPEETQAKA